MELIALLVVVSMQLLCKAEGSIAVTPLYVRTNGDVFLNIIEAVPKDFTFFDWDFKKTVKTLRFQPGKEPIFFGNYSGRSEFFVTNYSMKLRNLQDADSGVYTAKVLRLSGDQILAQYNVTVQDPVSPVELKGGSVSMSSDSCNFTVTCSARDSHINSTFRCVSQTCSHEEGEQSKVTTPGASLHVYLFNDSIICNQSNHVSQAEDIKMIEHFCSRHADPIGHHKDAAVTVVVPVVVAFLLLTIIIVAAVFYLRKKGKYNTECTENTVYEAPQVGTSAITLDRRWKPDTSDQSTTSTYCLVGPHSGSLGSTETKGTTLPESVYATVEKSARSSKS
ncbi:CD48 antigen-like [Plectropomus leopardus]|uniref:CD48 antigen-like n=1 Tax=Plectropomus leopardus TaxID=160734 RepID=UPI001C4C642C|nr:CD48 antigen-like [Plectropomus leopardus]